MFYSYFTFIFYYSLFSFIGLIVDLFYSDFKINKLSSQLVVSNYKFVSNNVLTNVYLTSLPVFIISELLFSTKQTKSLLTLLLQYCIVFIVGINIDYLIHRLRHSKYGINYHQIHHDYNQLFGYMTYYTHKYDFYLALIPLIFPIIFGFNQMVINHWIILYLCKHIIIDHSNIKNIGEFYSKHHKLKYKNFSDNVLDKYYNTLITKLKPENLNNTNKIEKVERNKTLQNTTYSQNHYLKAIHENE